MARVKVQSTSTMFSVLVSSWSSLYVRTMTLAYTTVSTMKMLVWLAQVRNYCVAWDSKFYFVLEFKEGHIALNDLL